jgi:UDP-N-acetylmuramate-alanine ligase
LLESCEYCDSFLNFSPTLAVILNVEADHLDYFKDLADVQKSFKAFANLSTGGVNFHGVFEYLPVESLRKMVEVLVALSSLQGE